MPRYIAFLRAINVGGRIVKMDRLRALFEDLRLSKVETVIASGNVIFETRSASPAALEAKIERHLRRALGYEVATFLRAPAELVAAAERRPFPADALADPKASLYVGFFRAPLPAAATTKLLALATDVDGLAVEGRELYWLIRGNMKASTLTGATIEKALGRPATLRNITTVRKLAAKM